MPDPVVTVENKTVVAGGWNHVRVTVTSGGAAAVGVALAIESIDMGKATAAWLNGNSTTNINGHATVKVTGVAAGTTTLVIKATVSGETGSGTVTVDNPVVTVEDETVGIGALDLVTVKVKTTGGERVTGVDLTIDDIDITTATAVWLSGDSTTNINGEASIKVTGIAAGTTTLRIKATTSGQTGSGTISVLTASSSSSGM